MLNKKKKVASHVHKSCRRNLKFSEFVSSVPKEFILFIETQPSLKFLRQVLMELLGLPNGGGFKEENQKKAVGLTLPRRNRI